MVWECNNKKSGRTKCASIHVYDNEMQYAVKLALVKLLSRYGNTISSCKEIWDAEFGSIPDDIHCYFDRFNNLPPNSVLFDNTIIRVLITTIKITSSHNLIFCFLDGSSFRYRISSESPKGRPSAYTKRKNHQNILNLHEMGYTATQICDGTMSGNMLAAKAVAFEVLEYERKTD